MNEIHPTMLELIITGTILGTLTGTIIISLMTILGFARLKINEAITIVTTLAIFVGGLIGFIFNK